MFRKKAISLIFAAFFLFALNGGASAALLHLSAGIPVSHSFSNFKITNSDADIDVTVEADGVSGTLMHASLILLPGLGVESYETKLKASDLDLLDGAKLKTTMYDLFYLLPVPIINLSFGVGLGSLELVCDDCSDVWYTGAGAAYQWFVQGGFPIIPLFDIHVSYHSITGTMLAKQDGKDAGYEDLDLSGSMMAVGVAFTF